jgi:hypothetical protein
LVIAAAAAFGLFAAWAKGPATDGVHTVSQLRAVLGNLSAPWLLVANRVFFEGGLVSGLVFGALGGWWARTKPVRLSILIGALLTAEPLVLLLSVVLPRGGVLGSESGLPLLIRIIPGWGLSIVSGPETAVDTVEFVAGLAIVLFGLLRVRRYRTAASPESVPTAV